MLEIAQNFEQTAAKLNTIVLISLGLTCTTVGLFVWLGGLGFKKLLVAVAGAVSGCICGFFIIGRNIISAVTLAALAALIAAALERVFIIILVAILATVFSFTFLAKPYIENATDFSTAIKQACLQMPAYSWVIIAVPIVILILAGIHLWRLTSALCCAALGTMLIFTGMILLLLYKGAMPISWVSRRTSFTAAVFVAMIAFGTIEQLLLCPSDKEKSIGKKDVNKIESEEKTLNWRSK